MAERDPELRLRHLCHAIKRRFLTMYWDANAGHVGSSLSCAEMLTFARFSLMREGDDLVLSKGHAAAALYSTLAQAGDIAEEEIDTFYEDGTRLSAHPPPHLAPHVPFATGSLGHGLSLAAGLALGKKLRGEGGKVICLSSDGELDEGTTWEALLFAAHHKLDNLVWLIDRNGLQGFGRTEDVMALEPLGDKLRAFGCAVTEADGHSFRDLQRAFEQLAPLPGLHGIICRTVKGNGVADTADTVACHYLPLSENQYRAVLADLGEPVALGSA